MPFRINNTLSGEIEEFKPLHDDKVGIYTCGPTVYDFPHIGNYRTFVFQDILRHEQCDGRRVVFENAGFLVFCPFASRFPFELCILPKRQAADFPTVKPEEKLQLAEALKITLGKLSRGLQQPQYNLILQTAPLRAGHRRSGYWDTIDQDFRWHLEILPRLTQTAGFEWGTGFYINPMPPEQSAAYLREVAL